MPTTTQTIINQFTIQNIIDTPCDSVFLNLLTHKVTIIRQYDNDEVVKSVNAYGEIIMNNSTEKVVGINIPARIEPISQRGESGFKSEIQGGVVRDTFRVFMCPEHYVEPSDILQAGNRRYEILLVDEYYGEAKLHHLQLLCKRIDNL